VGSYNNLRLTENDSDGGFGIDIGKKRVAR